MTVSLSHWQVTLILSMVSTSMAASWMRSISGKTGRLCMTSSPMGYLPESSRWSISPQQPALSERTSMMLSMRKRSGYSMATLMWTQLWVRLRRFKDESYKVIGIQNWTGSRISYALESNPSPKDRFELNVNSWDSLMRSVREAFTTLAGLVNALNGHWYCQSLSTLMTESKALLSPPLKFFQRFNPPLWCLNRGTGDKFNEQKRW